MLLGFVVTYWIISVGIGLWAALRVKNTGDFFNVSGSISDDKLGSIGSFGPLAPASDCRIRHAHQSSNY